MLNTVIPQAERAVLIKNTFLTVVTDTETGLYHGAVYRNHPTPSGCERWLLSLTTQRGFTSKRDAFLTIHTDFPDFSFSDVYTQFLDNSVVASMRIKQKANDGVTSKNGVML